MGSFGLGAKNSVKSNNSGLKKTYAEKAFSQYQRKKNEEKPSKVM